MVVGGRAAHGNVLVVCREDAVRVVVYMVLGNGTLWQWWIANEGNGMEMMKCHVSMVNDSLLGV